MKRRWGLFPFLLFFLLRVVSGRVQLGANTVFEFTAPVYNVSLEENARGTQFANSIDPIRIGVALPDKDATVRFKIVEGDKQHHFKAHARQVGDFVFLRIRQKDKHDTPLNRELRDNYDFLVKATCRQKDAGNLETTARVRLTITDRNDASPMFTLESDRYEAIISDQTPPFSDVVRIEASDADEGLNGQIYFSLLNRSTVFTVDPFSGWVRTLRPISAGIYELRAKAEDRTSRLFYYDEDQIQPAWTCLIVVNVNETKRRSLKITVEKKPIDSYITESVQLAAIIKVEEGDANTRLQLTEGDLKHWFTLVENGNYEWMLYTVSGRSIPAGTNVTLSAGNESVIGGNTTVTTEVTYMIDVKVKHTITFGQSRISFTVGESVPIGFVVGRISADVKLEEDKKILDNETIPFQLSERAGVLRVSELLDFEILKEYKFRVLVKLKGYNEHASLVVDVFVTDCNDHSPVWAAKWSRQGPIAIPDNHLPHKILLKVDALDQDAGDNRKIGYKLSADGTVPLKIGFETGEISLTSPLPKSQNEWRVSVWAVDWGKPLPRSTVLNLVFYRNGTKIPVKPRPIIGSDPPNKYSPVFEDIVDSIDIWEDAPIETVITKIRVYDKDVGYAGVIRFATWDDYFAIDSVTGEVTVADNLSDLLSSGVDSVTRNIEILASDLGSPQKTSKTTIRLTIRDVNNNSPVFDQVGNVVSYHLKLPWYHIRLSEDAKIGEVLLQVSASDDDFAENGRVGYRLAGGLNKHIQIDEKTGMITLVQTLDRESEDILRYTVVAFDHGTLQRMSFINLTITVNDVNDNPPMCIEPVTTVRIPEDFPDGALVGCLAARDLDIGENSHLRFSIDNEDHPPFRIDHHTGCIFVHSPHQPLDYEHKPMYNITIDVADNGETVLSTTCTFVIELLDIDENLYAPEFDDIAHEASVYENMPIGTEVFIVKAVDQDRNGLKLRYSFVGGDGMAYFSIDLSG
uniref:Cadherin domain-containing protein n=1 Tax=Heterorhabditis bacteriophora TaxID=37862 RepID=A0A1I7XKI7_HETBA